MRTSILIASVLAVLTMAAPTPTPAPSQACTPYCCQTLQLPDSTGMTKLLASLNIPRSDITGVIGIGCIAGHCPTTIVGSESCCTGPTMSSIVTSGCKYVGP